MSCSQLSSKPLNNEGGELSKEEGDAEENTHTRQNKVDEEEPETPMDSEAWKRKNCGECLQMVWAPFFCLPFLAQYAATNTINGKLHGQGSEDIWRILFPSRNTPDLHCYLPHIDSQKYRQPCISFSASVQSPLSETFKWNLIVKKKRCRSF